MTLTDPDAVERHSAEAVRLLSLSASVGFLSDPAQLKALLTDTAFARLNERPDFKELLSSQNQKVPSE